MKTIQLNFIMLLIILSISGCKKYLDEKSNQNLAVPDNLDDLELLLNNASDLNVGMVGGNIMTDEYYLRSNDWEALSLVNRNGYIWDPQTQNRYDWDYFYRSIFYGNTVLEQIVKLDRNTDPVRYDDLKGRALFLRAYSNYQLSQIYTPPLSGNENLNLGLPLRLSSDFNQPVTRSTLKETYDQINRDVLDAISLLPPRNRHSTQPSKLAALALAARMQLITGNYKDAYDYSDSALKISSGLIDYSTLDASLEFPFPQWSSNPELIYYTSTDIPAISYYWVARVDSSLYTEYEEGDLRKEVFFINNGDGTFSFKGNYTGNFLMFNGIATDELYLSKAEGAVRIGKINEALEALNSLLAKRWKSTDFEKVIITDPEALLKLILMERRKELLNRGLRWSDLRRLNADPKFKTTLKRIVNGQEYVLAPGDPRYTFLIPQQSINVSGIPQNPR